MAVETDWMNERMVTYPGHRAFYNLVCMLLFRWRKKFTYKEWYILLRQLNENQEFGNEFALKQILNIYKANNGRLPEGLIKNDE